MTTTKNIYLYGTCTIDLFFPEAGIDAITLLEAHQIQVHFPSEQTCCGQPAYTSGYPEQARQVALSQLAAFPENWPIVVLSGSCAGMMKHHYQHLFPKNHPQYIQARQFSQRIIEFSEFLHHHLKVTLTDHGKPVHVALHTACSAQREMDTLQSSRQLLSQLNNVSVVSPAHEEECCGFGGTFSVKFPDISGAMVNDKCTALEAVNIQHLISADCACLLNINGCLAKRQKTSLQGEHIASFLRHRCLPNTH
ncbi:(Fe-S)-binding protein [Zooshikella sp. RANM57]|uniref:(Fe-S)-binding protein n=1 Tax=Zooshikella sp. RANM57 TaxID=3425863 RepID=UPI003D6F894C